MLYPFNLYWAGRITLTCRRDDIPIYNAVFVRFFGDEQEGFTRAPRCEVQDVAKPPPIRGVGDRTDEAAEKEISIASPFEVLRKKSFARCTQEELRELFAAGERLIVPTRRSRRYAPARAGTLDFRRTLRASLRTGGEPFKRSWRTRREHPRRIVFLLDVSGSMAAYAKALLLFAHVGVRTQQHWETFCFATRLTHFTRALAHVKPDEALTRAAEEVVDWDGGTRIGNSLKDFLKEREYGSLARGAIVIICSDGLEIDDPEILKQQMVRLSRLANRVVWLNPQKEDPVYEPLTRGMRIAMPYIDVFESGHNLASLEYLTDLLGRNDAFLERGGRRRVHESE
ncbi:carbon monoxide dehydrogenase E protein [Aminobacter niigataensis]|nr:carbon monoxide dehydrogenase E protein [Aminobacter niigataensis]